MYKCQIKKRQEKGKKKRKLSYYGNKADSSILFLCSTSPLGMMEPLAGFRKWMDASLDLCLGSSR